MSTTVSEIDLIRMGIRMSATLKMIMPENGYSEKFDYLIDKYIDQLGKKVKEFMNE